MLVVVVVGGVGVLVQNVVDAKERKKVAGCDGASGLPRQSRHNRHANSPLRLDSYTAANCSSKERQIRFN